jgi:putative SOS response-associated peptidase YedK
MPVIISPESSSEWLDQETPEDRLLALLEPYPAEEMVLWEVSTAVNLPRNDGPECLDAA